MAAVDVVNDYLHGLPGGVRRLAHAEWGLTIAAEALGEPLEAAAPRLGQYAGEGDFVDGLA